MGNRVLVIGGGISGLSAAYDLTRAGADCTILEKQARVGGVIETRVSEGCTLECWLHGSRFDLRTGNPTGLPATVPVPVYPVEIRDGFVFVSLTPRNGVEK